VFDEALQIVPVAELPWAWNPFKCAHRAKFCAALPADLEADQRPPYFAAMVQGLTQPELEACPYHNCDWALAAAMTVWCFQYRVDPHGEQVSKRVAEQGGGWPELKAISSLFLRPIVWSPQSPTVSDGQHRVCALKVAGAERCIVEC